MAFIDEIKISAEAGRGGDGVVLWRHEKGKEFAGAAGGNGGKGGNVYLHAIRDLGILARYRTVKVFAAEPGQAGMNNSQHGANGDDIIIDLPVGSIVTNLETGKKIYLNTEGEKILLLEGGKGGLGNEYFKASTNVSPYQSTDGKLGETGEFYIELELVADLGLVGLPNAGKSSLLNELTNAKAKVASYQFTTLEPNLGDMYGFIIADIPGLIEGASEGKGLGHKFLRHIRRTKCLVHCVSLENEDIEEVYTTIRNELEKFDKELAAKPEILLLTKTDALTAVELKKKITIAKKLNKHILTVSILDEQSLKQLTDDLVKYLRDIESGK
ncbi:MAG: GTPase ObgE [Candidatus Paceibacterota bacterium]|jgi:GTP-binding protein